MLTKGQLTDKCEKMQRFLELKPGSEPHDLIDRIELLSVLISQSGECLADAKYLQDIAIGEAIQKSINLGYDQKLSISTINKYVNAEAKEFNWLVNTFDRINSASVHQLDGLRSILSYRKTEFATLSYGGK